MKNIVLSLMLALVVLTATVSVGFSNAGVCYEGPPPGSCQLTFRWCDYFCVGLGTICDTHVYDCSGTLHFQKGCCPVIYCQNTGTPFEQTPLESSQTPIIPVFGVIGFLRRRRMFLIGGIILLLGASFLVAQNGPEIDRVASYTLVQTNTTADGQSRRTLTQESPNKAYIKIEALTQNEWKVTYEGWMFSDNTSVHRKWENNTPGSLQYTDNLAVGTSLALKSSTKGLIDGTQYGVPVPVRCVERTLYNVKGTEFTCSSPALGIPVYSKTVLNTDGVEHVAAEAKTVEFYYGVKDAVPQIPDGPVSFTAFKGRNNNERLINLARSAFAAKGVAVTE